MLTQSYDIFRRDPGGEVWVEAVRDLETAKGRIIELAVDAPGQYVVLNHRSGRMVGSGTVVASPAVRAAKETQKSDSKIMAVETETMW
jgi:hypothetical protein